ncbi:MAG: carbohydrate-binding family 6 protein, partial [Bacteroidota bacterium]
MTKLMKTLLIDCSRFTVLHQKNFCLLLLVATLWGCASPEEKTITIYTNDESPTIQFAIGEIQQSLTEKNFDVEIKSDSDADIAILVEESNSNLKPEGFSLKKANDKVIITGIDAAGAMYGGLELAEQIKIHGLANVQEASHNPYMEMRGTKFNIPLDARSPSYTDASDVAQKNIGEMWNIEFWRDYIDQIARYRYNFISFWSLHPFPSLVKVPDYPDVALNDVHKSTATWDEYYSLGAQGLDAPEILNNFSVVKEISIEEKIEFWREVMAYAKSRNVDIYFITWNIFVNGTDGQYGITTDIDNEVTVDYFKKSVATMLRTYPDLAGIGLTTGENMKEVSFEQKEDWAFDTYGQGMLEVAQEMPDRQFVFIHRQHQADPQYIAQKFTPLIEQENIEFIYSFKYAKAHVFSATEQPYHQEFVK